MSTRQLTTTCCIALLLMPHVYAASAKSQMSPPAVAVRLNHIGCNSICFSPDDTLLASGGSVDWLGPGQVKLWNVHSGKLLHFDSVEQEMIRAVAFSPDGRDLAIVGEDGDEDHFIRDVKTWKRKRTLRGAVLSENLSYSPNGKYVASGGGQYEDGDEDPAYIWDAATGKRLARPSKSRGLAQLTFTADSKKLIGCGSGLVLIWEAPSGRLISKKVHPSVRCLALSPGGSTIATGSFAEDAEGHTAGDIRIWDVQTAKPMRTFTHDSGIVSIAYSPDGAIRASSDAKGLIRLTEANTGKVVRSWKVSISDRVGDEVSCLRFSHNGKLLAAIHESEIIIWALK